jgi:hypothetical protein
MRRLLCTFCSQEDVGLSVELIKFTYDLPYQKIYVFKNLSKPNSVVLSYNVEDYEHLIPNTISINRNGETNTLYTLNAMNKIIIQEVGFFDRSYRLNWENYRNKLLTTSSTGDLIENDLQLLEAKHIN